jgi:hypothetical protein
MPLSKTIFGAAVKRSKLVRCNYATAVQIV